MNGVIDIGYPYQAIGENLHFAVEGGDAVGKNTQTKKMCERLGATMFSSPNYDSPTGQEIARTWDNMLVRQALFAANRYERARAVLAALKRGSVGHDRYYLSSVVYGKVEGLDEDWLWEVHALLPQPRIHILLDAPVDEGFKRRPERRDANERNRDKLQLVRREYLRVFREAGPARGLTTTLASGEAVPVHFVIVNGEGTVDEVHNRMLDAIGSALAVS